MKTFQCFLCGKRNEKGITLWNEDEKNFKHLPKNKSAHLECYIDLAVDKSIKKQLKQN